MPTPAPATSTPIDSAFRGRSIWFVGAGGCGVSGLALMLQSLGASCRGADRERTSVTEALESAGITVVLGDEATVPDDVDLVIASAAVADDHPQLIAARTRGLEIMRYAQAVGRVQRERTGISIAGTHGKSTTTAMLCHTMLQCELDPSFIVGAQCPQIGGGARTGAGVVPRGPRSGAPGLFVVEACEFDRSFHQHRPRIGLIGNIEEDHLDIYGSLDAVIESFAEFAQRIPSSEDGGLLLIAHDGAHRRRVTAGLSCAVETFGFSPTADYQVVTDPTVRRVGILRDGMWLAQWTNALPGDHNALNAAAAVILAHTCGADWEDAARAMDQFEGLDRRMQRLGTRAIANGDVVVYDDYGHHPTEIDTTLRALRATERPERLICVFQPHQHSRTRFLLDEFAQSFEGADVVIVPPIYFVRDSELERQRVSARDLVDRLRSRGKTAMHLYPFAAITEQLEIIARPGDLLVIMGAGPVWQIAHDFLAAGDRTSPIVEIDVACP